MYTHVFIYTNNIVIFIYTISNPQLIYKSIFNALYVYNIYAKTPLKYINITYQQLLISELICVNLHFENILLLA